MDVKTRQKTCPEIGRNHFAQRVEAVYLILEPELGAEFRCKFSNNVVQVVAWREGQQFHTTKIRWTHAISLC